MCKTCIQRARSFAKSPYAMRAKHRREQIIDMFLNKGLEVKDMAVKLGMSKRMVQMHFMALYKKYRIRTGNKRVKLVVRLYREQLERSS